MDTDTRARAHRAQWSLGVAALLISSAPALGQTFVTVDFENFPISPTCDPVTVTQHGATFSNGRVREGGDPPSAKVYRNSQSPPCVSSDVGISFNKPVSGVSFELYSSDLFVISDGQGWSKTVDMRQIFPKKLTVTVPPVGVRNVYIDDLCDYYGGTECGNAWAFNVDNVKFIPSPVCLAISGDMVVAPKDSGTIVVDVTDCGGTHLPDVPITVSALVEEFSGGHNHSDSGRPEGRLRENLIGAGEVSFTGVSDVNGQLALEFVAPEVSGIHWIQVKCTDFDCTVPTDFEVQVKVEGLEGIPASSWYTLNETGGPDQGKEVGSTSEHPLNHFLMRSASENLEAVALNHAQSFAVLAARVPQQLHINDASLESGGKFDLLESGVWGGASSHAGHRMGTVVDIRANGDMERGSIAVDVVSTKRFKQSAQDAGAVAEVHKKGQHRHFHVLLLGEDE